MSSTASSNSHEKSEPSASQEKGGHEVPKTTTDSPEKPLNPHLPQDAPSPIEGFFQVDFADHERRTRHGVVLGNRPFHKGERELGPKDEDNEDNQSDSSGSSFVDSPIDGPNPEEAYQHLIASASAKKPEEELGPKDENREDGQSTTSGNFSPFVLPPPIGPAPVEALPALPAPFNPLLGPFTDTTPAHSIASPLTSEDGDFDPERSLPVDLDEGLYDSLGVTTPDFQSQTQSEIEDSVSPNTSTPPTPPPQHEPKNTGILANPRWSLKSQNTGVTPNTLSQTESEIEEPETRNTSVSPNPEPASEIEKSEGQRSDGDDIRRGSRRQPSEVGLQTLDGTDSHSAEQSERERSLAQEKRRSDSEHRTEFFRRLGKVRLLPQEVVDFYAYDTDHANADKDYRERALRALSKLESDFLETTSVLEDHNDSLVAGTARAVKNLGEFVRDKGKEVDALSDANKDLSDENKKLADKIKKLSAEDKELKELLSQAVEVEEASGKALEVAAAAKEENEELRQKLRVSEDNAREELGNLRGELQSTKLELELGNTASRDQLAATERDRESLQRHLKDGNQGIETLSKERDSAQASEKAATELLNLANREHAQIANALQGQIDILTRKKNEVEAALSDLQNKLTRLTQAHAENQDIIKDLKAKQEQIDKNDKTLSEGENKRINDEKDHLKSELARSKLELVKVGGEKQHFEDENKQLNIQIGFLAENTPQMITHTGCDNKYSGSIAENDKLKARIHVALSAIEDITRDANKSVRDAKTSPTSTSRKDFRAISLEEATAKLAKVVARDREDRHTDIIELRKQSVAIDRFENGEKRAMEEEVSRLKAEIKTLKAENERIQDEYDALKSSGGEQAHEVLRLKGQINGLRAQLAEAEKDIKDSVTERAVESLLFDETIAELRSQLAEKEGELEDSITEATANTLKLNETVAENNRKYDHEKARLTSGLSEAIAKKEESDRALDSLNSTIRAQLAQKEKELKDSITEATANTLKLNEIIAENSRKDNEEKAILAGDLAEAITKKEDSDRALESLKSKTGGNFSLGQNSLELEITRLNQKNVDLQREIEALTAKENRQPGNEAREGKCSETRTNEIILTICPIGKRDKDFHTRASFGLAIMDVELHLASMRITRAFNGITRDDHEPAIAAAQEAVTISELLKDNNLIAQGSFWLAVVQWYAGNTEDAGQLLGFIEQTLLPRREKQYLKEYIQICEDALDRPMEAAGYAKGLERSRSGSVSSDDSQAEGRHRH
jgi:chromosome segregation ATPase